MKIRFAEPRDVPGILTLLRQVGQVHHQGRPDLFRAGAQKYSASQILAILENTCTPIFVAAEEEKILGYGFCMVKTTHNDSVMTDSTTLYIDDLCVDEGSRGQHIGKAIYNTILAYARQRKCDSITLNVWAFNEPARKFYESLGMTPQKIGMEFSLEEA